MLPIQSFILAEADIPWILVAFVFIAFIRWIMEQISARRNPDFEEDYDDDEDYEPQRQRRQTTGEESPGEELRRFLESLAGEPPEEERQPPPPPVQRSAPPPPPKEKKKTPAPVLRSEDNLSKEEKAALERIRDKQSWEQKSKKRKQRHHTGVPTVASMLRNPETLRTAVILREVLGPPKALRDD